MCRRHLCSSGATRKFAVAPRHKRGGPLISVPFPRDFLAKARPKKLPNALTVLCASPFCDRTIGLAHRTGGARFPTLRYVTELGLNCRKRKSVAENGWNIRIFVSAPPIVVWKRESGSRLVFSIVLAGFCAEKTGGEARVRTGC